MPTEDYVTVYADRDFKGASQQLLPGRYNISYLTGQVGNDNISSIRIPEGWTVIVYIDADFKGASKTFTASAGDLGGFDDTISSIAISGTAQPEIARGTRIGVDSGVLQGSRIGFKGVENIGDGMQAFFILENGFAMDTGTER